MHVVLVGGKYGGARPPPGVDLGITIAEITYLSIISSGGEGLGQGLGLMM